MAVAVNDRRMEPITLSAGQRGPHSFDFRIEAAADLRVTRIRAGVETVLTLTTDYAVSGVGVTSGGTITLTADPLDYDELVIEAQEAIARGGDAVTSRLDAGTDINTPGDKVARILQDLRRDLDRCLRMPRDEAGAAIISAAARAKRLLAFDENGAPAQGPLITSLDELTKPGRLDAIDALSTAGRLAALDAILADLIGADTIGDAAALLAVASPGLVAKEADGTPVARTLTVGPGLKVSNPDGGAGNPLISLDSQDTDPPAAPSFMVKQPSGKIAHQPTAGAGLGDMVVANRLSEFNTDEKRLAARINLGASYIRRDFLEDFGSGVGAGDPVADQAALVAAAAAGAVVHLRKNTSYFFTGTVSPVSLFGVDADSAPGAEFVMVTQAKGSSLAGFKNYSGAAADRNAAGANLFFLIEDGAEYFFRGDLLIRAGKANGDAAEHQPIMRAIYGRNCSLNIDGMRVRGIDTCSGALNLNAMRGGTIWALDAVANAAMDESTDETLYTNVGSGYSPAGLIFDDEGSFRSSRMVFGDVFVADFNRDPSGPGAGQSDGVTLGGIDYEIREDHAEGHVFNSIRVERMGEGFDCFHRFCYVGSLVARDILSASLKFPHGAQGNTIAHVDITGTRYAGIGFGGSGPDSNPVFSKRHCMDNKVLGGRIAMGAVLNADAAPIHFTDNGADVLSVPKRNLVQNVQLIVATGSEYVLRSNLDLTSVGAIAPGEENRVINCPNLGAAPSVAYSLAGENGVRWDAASEFGTYVERATGGNQRHGLVKIATNLEIASRDGPSVISCNGIPNLFTSQTANEAFNGAASTGAFSSTITAAEPHGDDASPDKIVYQQFFSGRDNAEALVSVAAIFARFQSRAAGAYVGSLIYRLFGGGSFRDLTLDYDGIAMAASQRLAMGGQTVIDGDRLQRLRPYTVGTLPAAGTAGRAAYASNGRKAGQGAGAGTGVLVFDDGTNWIAADTGATVAA